MKKKITGVLVIWFCLLSTFSVHARSRTLKGWDIFGDTLFSANYTYTINCYEEECADVDSVYIKLSIPRKGLLHLSGMEARESGKTELSDMISLPYTLCDKNKKSIDPFGSKTTFFVFGVPNNPYFAVKAGTYYVKVDLQKKHIYRIVCSASLKALSSTGGTSKARAVVLKKAAKKRVFFPLGEDRKSELWFKIYSDGKNPVKIKYNLEDVNGAFVITYFGPSYPKGIKHELPRNKSWGDGGFAVKKDDRITTTRTTDTLARSNGVKTIGPKKGWYYIRICKSKLKGKSNQNYQKRSLSMTIKYK